MSEKPWRVPGSTTVATVATVATAGRPERQISHVLPSYILSTFPYDSFLHFDTLKLYTQDL